MTDPIDLDAYRPHEVSKVRCGNCGHKWTAVHPVGTTGFECPNCHEMEGQAMTDIVKGMVPAYNNAWTHIPEFDEIEVGQLKAMRAALLWLAANVTDEMLEAAESAAREHKRGMRVNDTKCDQRNMLAKQFAAAIRAAAGEEGK